MQRSATDVEHELSFDEVLFRKPGVASAKDFRHTENSSYPGGMRRPARSLQQNWASTMRLQGRSLASILDNVLDRFPGCVDVVDRLVHGCKVDGFSADAVSLAVKAVQLWCHAGHTQCAPHTSLRGGLIAAACRKFGDVEVAWASTLESSDEDEDEHEEEEDEED